MKTIEETAKEYSKDLVFTKESKMYIQRVDFEDAFKAGVEFAQRWIPIDEELPPYYNPVIVKDGDLEVIAWMACSDEGFNTYTINGTNIVMTKNPTHWRPIELK